jgi:nitrogen fixation/metabolism regulation signal transduction histidine kinase
MDSDSKKKKRIKISLTYKILAVVLGLPLIAFIIFGLIVMNNSTQELTKSTNSAMITTETFTLEKTQLLAQYSAGEISSYFSDRMREAQVYSSVPEVRELDWNGKIRDYFMSEVKRSNGVYDKLLIHLASSNFYSTAGDGKGNPALNGLYTSNNTNPNSKPTSVSDRDYYIAAINGVGIVSDPSISRSNGAKQIIIASPIRDNASNILGMVSISVTLNTLEKMMQEISVTEGGYNFLISRNGEYIYHPDKSLIINLKTDAAGKPILDEKGNKLENHIKITDSANAELAAIGKKMIAQETGYGKFSENGTNYYLVYAPVESSSYSLGLVIPESKIFESVNQRQAEGKESIRQLSQNIIMISVISILLLAVFALFMATRMTRQIKKLRNVTIKMADGDLEVKADTDSNDELGELAVAFNDMAGKIKQYKQEILNYGVELEKKVALRTAEFQKKIDELESKKKR